MEFIFYTNHPFGNDNNDFFIFHKFCLTKVPYNDLIEIHYLILTLTLCSLIILEP